VTAVATIGVYGFDQAGFLAALTRARVTVLLDVRQRRGVRGREYAWANSARLQAALADAGVEYRHLKELAPTTELRQLQYAEDDRRGVGKRSRVELAQALMCVERDPEACHRSLIAERMAAEHGVSVRHLKPS
jgi:uncharacterized protein (DUF488 family)